MKKVNPKKLTLKKIKVAILSVANGPRKKLEPISYRVYCTGECL